MAEIIFSKYFYYLILKVAIFFFLIRFYRLYYNLSFFKKKCYLVIRYNLVKKICITQIFFQIFIII